MGAEVDEVSGPPHQLSLGAYHHHAVRRSAQYLARYDGMRCGLRVMPPTGVPQTAADMIAYTREVRLRRRGQAPYHPSGTLHSLSARLPTPGVGSAQKVRHVDYRRLQEAGLRTGRRCSWPHQPVHRFTFGEKMDDPLAILHERHRHRPGQPRRCVLHYPSRPPVRRRLPPVGFQFIAPRRSDGVMETGCTSKPRWETAGTARSGTTSRPRGSTVWASEASEGRNNIMAEN